MNYFNFDGCKEDILLLSIHVVTYDVDIFLIMYVKNDNGVKTDSYNEEEISIIWMYNLKIRFTIKKQILIRYTMLQKIILKLWIFLYKSK